MGSFFSSAASAWAELRRRINEALHGDGVVVGGIGQDGDALMVEGGVQDRRQDHHGQQKGQGEAKPLPAFEI